MEQIDLNPPEIVKKEMKRSFRLRPVDTTGNLRRKYWYLKSTSIKIVAWSQLILGLIVLIAQILLLSVSTRFEEKNFAGAGFSFGMMQVLASVFALMVTKDAAYSWLHMTMGCNIVVAVGSFCFSGYLQFFYLQNIYMLTPKPEENIYAQDEFKFLIMCTWIVIISAWWSFPLSIFLAICNMKPVCCGQKDGLPISRRKSDEGKHKLSTDKATINTI